MGRKKGTTGKTARQKSRDDLIAKAKARLPSERSKVQCVGCFAPRNTLTVKSHVSRLWSKHEILISDTMSGLLIPCKHCKEIRYLNLSKFSLDVFRVDFETHSHFMLLKDDKYNAMIGVEADDKDLDLSGFMSE